MNITLYTTHCPQCKVLTKKLDMANIKYDVVDDKEEFVKRGFKSAPILVVDEQVLKFADAIRWVGEQNK